MSKFKVGDKVKCIENVFYESIFDLISSYTVKATKKVGETIQLIMLDGFDEYQWMDGTRFELIEQPTAITEGKKLDEGKPDLSLLPFEALEEVAKALEFGAVKYGRTNWKNGIDITRLDAAALRHLGKFTDGEDLDSESGLSHLAHAACNILFMIWTMKNKPELDNRIDKDKK